MGRACAASPGRVQAAPQHHSVVMRWNGDEVVGARHRAVDILGAQHLAPDLQALLEQIALIFRTFGHGGTPRVDGGGER